ncbi:interferon-stimulated 20 kDa exonuclease-like 2 [Apteryx mantelli]|uniref:Interferon-stimulated 20 kDa exonuclease-like 2 n=1 Tax=Apteryx mantelli TaxID=2696672 RepID=A0A8B7JLZ2_9AVES
MSDLILNVNFGLSEPSKKGAAGNQKHKNFLKRRRFLERKGVLKQKQLPPAQQQAAKGSRKKSGSWGRNAKKQRAADVAGRDQSKTYPKVNNPQPSPAAQNNSTGSKRTCFPKGTCASVKGKKSAPLLPAVPSKLVAIDCEMVGTGPGGRVSDLARCSIVSYDGDVVYDQYIRPANPIVDYRTRWSGIKRHHMVNAVPFGKAQREILKILSGKIVVGHAICNDFKALKYFHPHSLTRDTSKIPLLNRKGGFPENVSISLKRLTKQLLRKDIQVGKSGHSSVEDARATMELYKVVEAEWEQHLTQNPEQE